MPASHPDESAHPRRPAATRVERSEADEVVELVGAAMDTFDAAGEAGLARYLASLTRHADEVRRRIEALRRVGLIGAPAPSAPAAHVGETPRPGSGGAGTLRATVPERLGDFELIEPLGRGGMGVVYRARQISLDREVAVKLIRPEQLYFPGVRERFQREVGIVARLQHEGIVRLYSFGEDQGIPWFAMERIVGCSLADVLQRLGGRDPRDLTGGDLARCIPGSVAEDRSDSLFEGSWAEVVLRILERAALALDEAHRQGVLHRDIKPSNIMLTPGGRVVLLDFGLAWSADTDALTRSGAELGTIHYMAPEQFRGATAEVDERTDVYALGVVLRELLTLRPVFTGRTIDVVARQVREGLTSPFGRRGSSGALEFETVCLVAMDREPERRYATARAFARDLQNLLEHRPITAARPKLGLRLRRYAQRHPALAAATSVGLVALLTAPLVVAVRERGLRVRLQSTNAELEAAVLRADQNFGLAATALESAMQRIDDQKILEVPDLEGFVDDVLVDTSSFLDALVANNPRDPEARLELAATLLGAARVRWQFFDLAKTEPLFARVLELLETSTGDRERIDALGLEARLSLIYLRRRTNEEAIVDYLAALDSVKASGPYSSRSVAVRIQIARALERCGGLLTDSGQARGRAMLLEAQALREANALEQPSAETFLDVAKGAAVLADEREDAQDPEAAAVYHAMNEAALWRADAAAAEPTASAQDCIDVASALTARSYRYQFTDRFDVSAKLLEAALRHWEHLLAERPSRLEARFGCVSAFQRLAPALNALGRRAEAEAGLRRAVEIVDDALAIWRGEPALYRSLVSLLNGLADHVHADRGRTAEAHALLDRSSALADEIAAMNLTGAALHETCSNVYLMRAKFLVLAGDVPGATAELERYRLRFEHALTFAARDRVHTRYAPLARLVAAEARLVTGDTEGALRALEKLPAVLASTIDEFPQLRARRAEPPFQELLRTL